MFKKSSWLLAATMLVVVAFHSCKKENEEFTKGTTASYYPLVLGKHISYKVDSTIYDDFNKVTFKRTAYLLYTTEDSFRDAQDRLSYTVSIMNRTKETDPWEPKDVIYVTPTAYGLDVVQNNLRFQKLAFPIEQGLTWKGNSQIAAGDQDYVFYQGWDYEYLNVGNAAVYNAVTYPNTITVLERDEKINDPDVIKDAYAERTYSRAVYGFGVGLLEKELIRWVYQYNPSDPNAAYRKGYELKMTIMEYN